jgi:2-polyprenyl-3-methyl-5-hydroxy-6-metoxy-1,4-benzoquinol methylase
METTTMTKIDAKKVEAFLGRVVTDFGAALSVTLSYMGDKLGLYKAMANAGPISAAELAKKTSSSESYVKDWLINQAAGGYIEYDASSGKYILPDEHAMALTDEKSPFYVAGGFQVINAMIQARDRIESNFKTGEGMKWGEHHHDLFEGTERFFRPSYLGNLLGNWLPAVSNIMTRLKEGISVADLGCGYGASTIILAETFPKSRFMGFDNHAPSIEEAQKMASAKKLDNLTFAVSGAQDFIGQYDFITFFDCLHDMGDPVGALKNCLNHLNERGLIMAVEPMAGRRVEENFNPVGRVYSGASVLCCTPNALATGGYALGTVASDDELEKVAKKAGFTRFRRATETPFNRVFEIKP